MDFKKDDRPFLFGPCMNVFKVVSRQNKKVDATGLDVTVSELVSVILKELLSRYK